MQSLCLMLVSILGFWNKDMVDWESRSIHSETLPVTSAYTSITACLKSFVPVSIAPLMSVGQSLA